jgi:amino acid transporter
MPYLITIVSVIITVFLVILISGGMSWLGLLALSLFMLLLASLFLNICGFIALHEEQKITRGLRANIKEHLINQIAMQHELNELDGS